MTDLRTAAQQALEAMEVATNCLEGYYIRRLVRAEAQRDALLEALRPFAAINASVGFTYKDVDRARAAIKQAEENT